MAWLLADRYEIEGRVGQADELCAKDTRTGKAVVLRWRDADHSWPSHPATVRLLDHVEHDGRQVAVEEVTTRLDQIDAALTPAAVARLFDGLGWLHSRGCGLLGLASSAVRVDASGRLKLRPPPGATPAPGDVLLLVGILASASATKAAVARPGLPGLTAPAQVAAVLRGGAATPSAPVPGASVPPPRPAAPGQPRATAEGVSREGPISPEARVTPAGPQAPPRSPEPPPPPPRPSAPPPLDPILTTTPVPPSRVETSLSEVARGDEESLEVADVGRTRGRVSVGLAVAGVLGIALLFGIMLVIVTLATGRSTDSRSGRAEPAVGGDTAEQEYSLGYSLLAQHETDRAMVHLKRCTELDRDHAGCWWELGWAHWRQENWSRVTYCWEQVARLDPDRPSLGRWLKEARLKNGTMLSAPSSQYLTQSRRVRDGRRLSRSSVVGLSCEELWGLRNWVFARHGFDFQTEAARRYFDRHGAYRPVAGRGGREVARLLTPSDEANRDLILELEDRHGCK